MPFAQQLWQAMLRDLPLISGPLTLFFAATIMLWPGDLLLPRHKKHIWAPFTLGVLAVSAALVATTANGSGFSSMFQVDGFTRGFQLLCTAAAFITVVLSQPQLNALQEQMSGLAIGEEIAISVLEDTVNTITEDYPGFRLTRFDGTEIVIGKAS